MASNSSTTTSNLTVLLPETPYTLAYTLPLLLLSTLLLFSGTFLTLDRTRSFPRRTPGSSAVDYSAVPPFFEVGPKKKQRRFTWYLEGGVGGIAIGYVSGVHFSTLLALVIPATTSSSHLSQNSFLAVWIISTIPITILSARYRLAPRIFAGLCGGLCISIGLSIILHPSLLPRLILLGTFTTLLTVLVLLSTYIPRLTYRILHPLMRMCTSSIGAFGFVLSIALLLNMNEVKGQETPPSFSASAGWANAWERFWVKDGEDWGKGREKGLSAAWAILWFVGTLTDWGLRRWLGESPDEKWDDYLSKYVSDLPINHGGRAGTFRPLVGFWERIFKSSSKSELKEHDLFLRNSSSIKEKDGKMLFPSDKDMRSSKRHSLPKDSLEKSGSVEILDDYGVGPDAKVNTKVDVEVVEVPIPNKFLKKPKNQKRNKGFFKPRTRKPIKFGGGEVSSSDNEEDDSREQVKEANVKPRRPQLVANHTSYASSSGTLVDGPPNPKAEGKPKPHSKSRSSSQGKLNPKSKSGQSSPIPEIDVNMVDYDKEIEEMRRARGERWVEGGGYYSGEEDVVDGRMHPQRGGHAPAVTPTASFPAYYTPGSHPGADGWKPAFFLRHDLAYPGGRSAQSPRDGDGDDLALLPPPGIEAIPATPSLIRAVERVDAARRELWNRHDHSAPHRDGHRDEQTVAKVDLFVEDGLRDARRRGGEEAQGEELAVRTGRAPRWEEFWREVGSRAKEQS